MGLLGRETGQAQIFHNLFFLGLNVVLVLGKQRIRVKPRVRSGAPLRSRVPLRCGFVFFVRQMSLPLSSLPMATGILNLPLPSNETLGRQIHGNNFHFYFVRVFVTACYDLSSILILTSNYYGYLRYLKEREGEIVTFGDGGRKVRGVVAAKTAGKTAEARKLALTLVFRFLFLICGLMTTST